MPTNTTLQSLFGASAKIQIPASGVEVDRQAFAFPGQSGRYQVALGDSGERITVEGLCRLSGANQAAAVTSFQTLYNTLMLYKSLGTVLNILSGGGAFARVESLYSITASAATSFLRRVVVAEPTIFRNRQFSSGTILLTVPFTVTFQRVA